MKRYHYGAISSTNDYAKEHLLQDDRVVVTADFQSVGRGRNSKSWKGGFGENVYFSWGLNHPEPIEYKNAMLYQGLAAIAVKHCLNRFAPEAVFKLKYPNDIYAMSAGGYKKISGNLVEHSFFGDKCKSTVLGIGINVNQTNFSEELNNNAVSLKDFVHELFVDDIYNALIDELELLDSLPKSEIFNLWLDELEIIGKKLEVVGKEGVWIAEKVLDDGRICARADATNEEMYIDNGDSVRYNL